jgi:Ca2+-binding RTX toxin-like protein
MSTAFANGASKWFYVGTAFGPGDANSRYEFIDTATVDLSGGLPAYDASILQVTSNSMKTFTTELDFFTSGSVINETRDGNSVTEAVHKFTDGVRTAYVIWGNSSTSPSDLPDTVRSVTATGTATTVSSSSLTYSTDPTIVSTFQEGTGSNSGDAFIGWANTDVMTAGDGADSISGAAGNDLIYGNKETDLLYRDDGKDTLYGGADNGTLFGGDGSDVYVMDSGDDVIGDFDTGVDKISTSLTRTSTTASGSDSVITFSDGSTLTLTGVSASAVTDSLFL